MENAEAELEGPDMSPHTIEALNTLFDAEYDVNARLRNKPGDAAPSGTSTKVRRKGTRVPAPITAAFTNLLVGRRSQTVSDLDDDGSPVRERSSHQGTLRRLDSFSKNWFVFRPEILLNFFLLNCIPSFFSLLSLLCLLSLFFSLFNILSEIDLPMDF